MPRQIIDISVFLANPSDGQPALDPPALAPRIEYLTHHDSFHRLAPFFPGLTPQELPDAEAWATEKVRLTTHCGTHLEVPATRDGPMTVDQVPLEWCFQPAVRLDLRHLAPGSVVSREVLQSALGHMGHRLSPLEILLLHTQAEPAPPRASLVMEPQARDWLVDAGVRLCGTDALRWQEADGGARPDHAGLCRLLRLTHLELLPARGFHVACFAHKVRAGSAGWTRAVAILDAGLNAR